MVRDPGVGDVTESAMEEAEKVSSAIKSGATTLLDLVQAMGPKLNSEEVKERNEALGTIAQILRKLPSNFLAQLEIAALLQYFIAQLKGRHPDTARIAIHALDTMFERYTVSSEDALTFVERFFNESALVDLTRDDKMTLYRLFQRVFSNDEHFETIARQMSSALLPGFLQLIELETDPQCLVICFEMYLRVVRRIPLGVYVEDVFEYPAGYFPIDFNGSPDRHGGVSRDQLQEALTECLLAHSDFAKHVFDLCIEKLSSDVRQAQLDAMKLLKLAALKFDCSVSCDHLDSIWPLLRKLYLNHGEDRQLQEAIFRTTTVLAQRIGEAEDGDAKLEQFASIIWKDFEDREAFLDHGGWRFVVAYAGGSKESANKIFPKAFTKVTHMMADGSPISSSLLDAACAMLTVLVSVHKDPGSRTVPRSSLSPATLSSAEMAVGQACRLLMEPSCTDHREKLLALIEFALPIEKILGESQIESLRSFIEVCVVEQSSTSSNVPTARTRSLFNVLKRCIASCSVFYGEVFIADLHSLARERRCVWLLAGLVQKEDKDGGLKNNAKEICEELFVIGGSEAFVAIREIVLNFPTETTAAAFDGLFSVTDLRDADLQAYEDLLTIVIRETARSQHKLSEIRSILMRLQEQLQPPAPPATTRLHLFQLRVVLSNCPTSCLEDPLASAIVAELIEISGSLCRDNGPEIHQEALTGGGADNVSWLAQCLALLANKVATGTPSERSIVDALNRLSCDEKSSTSDHSQQSLMTVYLVKGLLLRGHQFCEEALGIALKDVPKSIEAAKNFAILAQPQPTIFPKDGHCSVRLLYPQRLLSFALPRLLEAFSSGSDSERLNISVAICSSIHNVSSTTAEAFLPKLKPVVEWCLSQPAVPADASGGLLHCIRWCLPQLAVDNVLPSLLRWTERPAPMELRQGALACLLDVLSHFEIYQLLPYKRQVVRHLPVGDRKRLIRRAASATAVAWHMLGE